MRNEDEVYEADPFTVIPPPQAPNALPVVTPVEVSATEPEPKPVSYDDTEDLSDIGSLSDEDRNHLFGLEGIGDVGGEDDLSDLVDVSDEDIIGEAPEPEKKRFKVLPRGHRVIRRYQLPPGTSLGGTRQ